MRQYPAAQAPLVRAGVVHELLQALDGLNPFWRVDSIMLLSELLEGAMASDAEAAVRQAHRLSLLAETYKDYYMMEVIDNIRFQ